MEKRRRKKMSKLKGLVGTILNAMGINGKTALVLKIIAMICAAGAWAADSIIEDAKNERVMEKIVTEKIQEMIANGTLKVK